MSRALIDRQLIATVSPYIIDFITLTDVPIGLVALWSSSVILHYNTK
jgi:hypothetical protein